MGEYTFIELSKRALSELVEAETAANNAAVRRAYLKTLLIPELEARYAGRTQPVTEKVVTSVLDSRCGDDPKWKSEAGSNRWHLEQSRTFSLAALVMAENDRRRESKK